jgi:hypothetical protein
MGGNVFPPMRPRRLRGHMAFVPFLRGDYEKESTAACSDAACSCGVFRRRLRPCRTKRKPIGARIVRNTSVDGGVRNAVDTCTDNNRTILAHGRLDYAERDR